jgi:ATP-dependent Clp protease ATP-binding subunit ClpA
MFERFTDRARKVMALANQEAQRFNHEYIGTEHVLLGICKEGSGVGANVLRNMYIDLYILRLEVEKHVRSGPETVTLGKLPQTPRTKKVIEYATEDARSLGHNHVGTEHLLLGLLREKEGVACQVLRDLNLELDEVRTETLELLGQEVRQIKVLSQDEVIVAGKETLAPFSLRFDSKALKCELLDAESNSVDSFEFGGIVGMYTFNALRKHEATQKLLRDLKEFLKNEQGSDPSCAVISKLLRRINRLLDGKVV